MCDDTICQCQGGVSLLYSSVPLLLPVEGRDRALYRGRGEMGHYIEGGRGVEGGRGII